MAITLLSYALTTADRFKDYIGKSSLTATETSVANGIINAVTNYIENYIGRRIQETAYTSEIYDGPFEEMIVLKNWPVNSSETFTLQYRTSGSNENTWSTVNTTAYFIDYDDGIIYKAGRSKFLLSRHRYKVDYTAGFTFDNAATFLGDTEAADLELACWMMASEIWHTRKGNPGKKSERIGDYAVTFGDGILSGTGEGLNGATSIALATLDKYKRIEASSYLTPPASTQNELDVWSPEEIGV